MSKAPIVMVSSCTPRLCGIATFTEEAREFIQKANPDREVLVVSHLDGKGEGVYPVIDIQEHGWWKVAAETIRSLNPHVIHFEHEYGLYEHVDERQVGDGNAGFLALLEALSDFPLIVEPHTVHGRLFDHEADFIYRLCQRAHIVLFKCAYQRWRLEWTFGTRGWAVPDNIMIVPHGARSDRSYSKAELGQFRENNGLGTEDIKYIGMIGWIQSNKRWDIVLSAWEEVRSQIAKTTAGDWQLLVAGSMRDPNHESDYRKWKEAALALEEKGIARFIDFVPRGEDYYRMMAVCEAVVLPTFDETQSGTLARVISLRRPFLTTAPMEGLTTQALDSEGGLLFTSKEMLREKLVRLACDEGLRAQLGVSLGRYLSSTVSWEIVAAQYNDAYRLAEKSLRSGQPARLRSIN